MLETPVAVPEVAPAGDDVFYWLVDCPHVYEKRPLETNEPEIV